MNRRLQNFEKLESRELLAADLITAQWDAAPLDMANTVTALIGEGEATDGGDNSESPDLVAFAKQLSASDTKLYCAAWSADCAAQKELFEDGGKYLPIVEVTNLDRTFNQTAIDNAISSFPTWEFADESRLEGAQTLETIAARAEMMIPTSSLPSFAEVGDQTVGIGSPLHLPIDAYNPSGEPLTVTVVSSDPSLLKASVLDGNRSLQLSVEGYGDMVFELFEQRAPRPTARVVTLAESGFYDGTIFHRVVEDFVIQGGDPTGTGQGGSELGDFDDQYHLDLQHNSEGILSYAKSNDDTNDSQFFITDSPARYLDFNHSVFGTMVEGFENRAAIDQIPVNENDLPDFDVVLATATIFDDTENGVVLLKPTGNGTGTVSVTISVADTEGNQVNETIEVTVEEDSANGGPFLNEIADVTTIVNHPTTFQVSSQDKENDTVAYQAIALGSVGFGVEFDSASGEITVTPPEDYVGELFLGVAVEQTTPTTTASQYDTQIITIDVQPSTHLNPTDAYDVNADEAVSPIDALIVINHLNSGGATDVLNLPDGPPLMDVNGDGSISPIDALMVINRLNAGDGEGESLDVGDSIWWDSDSLHRDVVDLVFDGDLLPADSQFHVDRSDDDQSTDAPLFEDLPTDLEDLRMLRRKWLGLPPRFR